MFSGHILTDMFDWRSLLVYFCVDIFWQNMFLFEFVCNWRWSGVNHGARNHLLNFLEDDVHYSVTEDVFVQIQWNFCMWYSTWCSGACRSRFYWNLKLWLCDISNEDCIIHLTFRRLYSAIKHPDLATIWGDTDDSLFKKDTERGGDLLVQLVIFYERKVYLGYSMDSKWMLTVFVAWLKNWIYILRRCSNMICL